MKTTHLVFGSLGLISLLLASGCRTNEATALEQAQYSPPELETKQWDGYLYNGTVSLIQEKKYEEALTRLVWFWEHILEHNPGMYGVRRSFLLGIWADLGKQYPPALAELKQIRDDSEKRALTGDDEAFGDVAAIDNELKEQNRTIELFKELDRTQPDAAKKALRFADNALIANGEYALSLKYGPTPEERWELLLPRMKEDLSPEWAMKILTFSDPNRQVSPEQIKEHRKLTVKYFRSMEIAPLVKLCNNTGKTKLAEEIEATFKELIKPIEDAPPAPPKPDKQ